MARVESREEDAVEHSNQRESIADCMDAVVTRVKELVHDVEREQEAANQGVSRVLDDSLIRIFLEQQEREREREVRGPKERRT